MSLLRKAFGVGLTNHLGSEVRADDLRYHTISDPMSDPYFFHIITRYHRQLEVVPSHHREPESAEREPEKARERERAREKTRERARESESQREGAK